ncbi:hypothetical protein [Bacillus paralicheniformis]|uniref:hypothetical protein n=1 Tax=Bacillus paralicheniformis TaxID=1648923 RepID=UPI00189C7F18|nr:hypothetical protein [Bacillus paralicheniformis]
MEQWNGQSVVKTKLIATESPLTTLFDLTAGAMVNTEQTETSDSSRNNSMT